MARFLTICAAAAFILATAAWIVSSDGVRAAAGFVATHPVLAMLIAAAGAFGTWMLLRKIHQLVDRVDTLIGVLIRLAEHLDRALRLEPTPPATAQPLTGGRRARCFLAAALLSLIAATVVV